MAFDDHISPNGPKDNNLRDVYEKTFNEEKEPKVKRTSGKKKITPVISGNEVTVKKPSFVSRIADIFIDTDPDTVRKEVFKKIFVPSVKDLFTDMVMGGLNMLFYNNAPYEPRTGRRRRGYENAYNDRRNGKVSHIEDSDASERHSGGRLARVLEFDSLLKAERVKDSIIDLYEEWGVVSVGDVLGLCNRKDLITFVDEEWGWEDLNGINTGRLGHGKYTVYLPRTKRIK